MKNFCDRVPGTALSRFSITATVLAALSAALLAGCGGGGGGGGGSSSGGQGTPQTETFSGTLVNTVSSVIPSGYTVRFDNTNITTTSSSSATFTLTVPSTDITGDDTIFALDSNNAVVGSTTITNDTSGATGLTIDIGPPGTPPLDKKK